MNHPKAHQVRLPFSVPRPKKGEAATVRICGICRSKDSKYACPRCNIPYCSLDCFKAQAHVQCSEAFYRDTILSDIATDPSQSTDEKKRMMDILQRLQEGQEDDEDLIRQLTEMGQMDGKSDNAEDIGDDEELASTLEGVDLDGIDEDTLWQMLPKSHRDRFLATVQNPQSAETLALVDAASRRTASGGGDDPDVGPRQAVDDLPSCMPWWSRPSVAEATDLSESGAQSNEGENGVKPVLPDRAYAALPEMIHQHILTGIKVPDGTGAKLRYNAVAIGIAYLTTLLELRLPSLAPEHLSKSPNKELQFRQSISHLIPFLTSVRSTTRYEYLGPAYLSVWELMAGPSPTHTPATNSSPLSITSSNPTTPPEAHLLPNLLDMLIPLLHPPIDQSEHVGILRVISDMYALYERHKKGGSVSRKLGFYAVALRQLGRADWLELEAQVRRECTRLKEELGVGDDDEDVDGEERGKGNYLP